jgi:LSU ribosomal protein L4P
LYKGGGTIFGPKPRDYDFKLNRKVKELAKMSALSYKAKEDAIVVVEDINLAAPKTKEFVEILNNLQLNGKKVLVVMEQNNENLFLSLRNLPRVESTLIYDINTYDIVNADALLITESAARVFAEATEEDEVAA